MAQRNDVIQDRYLADGFYAHPDPVIPAAAVAAAVAGMEAVIQGEYETNEPPQPSPWQPGDDPASKLVKIEMPQIASLAIRALLNEPALGELAARVTGAGAVQVWWVQLLRKPPARPGVAATTNVGWHQDRHYWDVWDDDSELFTAWVALSDVTTASGAMRFVRGSHHWGLGDESDFHGQDLDALRARIAADGDGSWDEVAAVLPPGGASFHHSLTYHASGPNLSAGPRRSFAVHLRTENSRPRDDRRSGLAKFIDNLDYCPVIYGKRADFRG